MLLVVAGHPFLIDEHARMALSKHGFVPRDVPWLEEDVTPELVAANLEGGLFGPAALVVAASACKDYKACLAPVLQAPDALVVWLDAENWGAGESSGEVMRKRKAQEARLKHYGSLEKHIQVDVVVLPTPQKGALVKWISDRAKSQKIQLEIEAARALAEIFPDDPASIAGELEKLGSLEGRVDAETLRRIVNHLPPTNVFNVLDAVARKQAAQAMDHLARLLAAGEDPFKIMGALQGAYQLQARAWALKTKDPMQSNDEIAKALSVHPFRAQKALEASRNYNEKRLLNELRSILQSDVRMKSGGEPALLLETLVLELASN